MKTRTPGLVKQSFTITEQDVLATHALYPLTQKIMRSDLYMPNRLSMNCSRRNCSFGGIASWNGGEVPEV